MKAKVRGHKRMRPLYSGDPIIRGMNGLVGAQMGPAMMVAWLYLNISHKDVHVCYTNSKNKMERNSHGTIERRKNDCFPRTLKLKTRVQQKSTNVMLMEGASS
jgi:hypothetical protein